MKIKKISAIILAGALLASAVGMNAFADSTGTKPTITVFGNESSPAKPGESVVVNVRLSDFSTVAGMDISLNGTDSAFEKIESSDIKLEKDSNYKLTDNKIHIVELNEKDVINLKVTVKASATANLTVNAELAKDGKDLIKDFTIKDGKVVVGTTSATVEEGKTKLAAETGYFIPFGSVYDNNGFIDKDGNGKFTVSAGTTYQQFAIPDDITTFGVSDMFKASNNKNNLQFGTYANNYNNSNYGTMLILGDFNTAADYVREKSGWSVEKLLSTVSNAFDENNIKTDGSEYLPVVCKDSNGNKVELKVIKVLQTKYLWKNTDESACEYALRVINVKDSETYTAVGYHGSVLSTEIKTEKYTTKE